MQNSLLAAIDVRSAMTVAMIVIGFVVWIIRQIAAAKDNAPPPTVRPRRSANRNDPLQNEIEQFIRESGDKKRDDSLIEVVPEEEIVRRKRERANRPQRPTAATPPQRGQTPRKRASESPPPQTVGSADQLGSGLRSHLQEYMESRRVEQSVQQHLASGVQRSVQQHLGSAKETELGIMRRGEHSLVAALRNPVSLQQAVIFSEIMTPKYKKKH